MTFKTLITFFMFFFLVGCSAASSPEPQSAEKKEITREVQKEEIILPDNAVFYQVVKKYWAELMDVNEAEALKCWLQRTPTPDNLGFSNAYKITTRKLLNQEILFVPESVSYHNGGRVLDKDAEADLIIIKGFLAVDKSKKFIRIFLVKINGKWLIGNIYDINGSYFLVTKADIRELLTPIQSIKHQVEAMIEARLSDNIQKYFDESYKIRLSRTLPEISSESEPTIIDSYKQGNNFYVQVMYSNNSQETLIETYLIECREGRFSLQNAEAAWLASNYSLIE